MKYPKNIWILCITAALSSTAMPFFILIGGLMGAALAPKPEWATLPIAVVVVGSAMTMVPSVYLLKCFGRKYGSILGIFLLFIGALMCALADAAASFTLLLAGAVLLGAGTAFTLQFRFAVIESLNDEKDAPQALSFLLLSGAVAAVIGPEIAVRGKDLLSFEGGYTGSFILLAGVNALALAVFSAFKNPVINSEEHAEVSRPLQKIVAQPLFLTAITAAAIGFALMSFLMTATPVTMHHFHGHSVADAKWVIQSHMLAMFLPSLITGKLIQRFGESVIIFVGAILYAVVIVVALQGVALMHFWWALVLLGVGWNFLFIGGTSLLPKTYAHAERFKAQAFNDLVVFSMQATASLSAGWVLYRFGWSAQLLICIPFILTAFLLAGGLMLKERRART